MPAIPARLLELAPADRLQLEAWLAEFEEAWDEHLLAARVERLPPPGQPLRLPALIELVKIDLERRWQCGRHLSLNDYLARYPELGPVEALPPDLLLAEEEVGRQCGEGPATLPAHAAGAEAGSPDLSQPAPLAASRVPRVRGYEVLGKLGQGGMGAVYKAHHLRLNRLVALKVVGDAPNARPEDLVRFRQEAEMIARLQHASIVQIYEVGEYPGGSYLALEYVDGPGLDRQVNGMPQPPRQAARLVEILARAVHYAHGQGIIHRDLKPANVLLTAAGAPKITDFGLARRVKLESGLTTAGAIMGTPSYMAPEQAEGRLKDIGPHTDTYALGAILYECLTGRPPFQGATVLDTLLKVREEQPVPPHRLLGSNRRSCPADLETICLKCLEKDSQRRYASAGALADDLGRYLAGEPIAARPVRGWERGVKWAGRHPTAAALLVTVALVVTVGVPGLTLLWLRADWAQREEARQRAAAERERAVAQAVSAFLQHDLLGQADIGNQPRLGGTAERDRDVKVRELLDRAAAALPGKFADQPEVEAAIRQTIGNTYRALGEYAQAQAHLERVVAWRHQHLGPDHPDTLTTMNNLARAYLNIGQGDKAVALFEQALAKRQATLGPDHPDTLQSMGSLAGAYGFTGQLAKAVPLYEQTLAKKKEKLGPDHPSTLTTMNNLGTAYGDAGQRDKAVPLLEQALAKRQATLGPDHPDTLTSMVSLALAYRDVGQREKAVPLLEETLAQRQATLGPDHPDTLYSLNNLALAYYVAGQRDKAVPLLEQTLAQRQATLGPDHPATLTSMYNLARAYQDLGQGDKAVPLLEQTLAKRKETLGPNHPDTPQSMANLALAYRDVGQLDKTVPLLEQTVAKMKDKLGPDHSDTLNSLNNLAGAYWEVGQRDKALPLWEQTVAKMKDKLGPDHPITLTSQHNLAEAYQDLGQRDKAVPLLEETLVKRRQRLGPDHPDTLQSMSSRAMAYQQNGEFAQAERMLRDCLTRCQQKQPDAWTTFLTQSRLGGCLLGQQRYAEAEPLLAAGYEGMKQREPKVHASAKKYLAEALERLVQLYDAWGKPEQAQAWRQQLEQAKTPKRTPKN